LNTASGSTITRLGALEVTSGSNITRLSALETASGSAITRLGALEVTSGSNITRLGALETASGSAITRLGSIEVVTGSNITRLSSLEAKTGSYATTGSNTFIGSQVVSGSIVQSGSFTTTGTIIAQTINVQTVTSSIVYSSGSNIFGNLLGDSQTFTGSVLVTGSLTIAGGSSAASYSGATIYGSTAVCSPVGKFTTCIDAGTGYFSGQLCSITGVFGSKGGGTYGILISDNDQSNVRLKFTNTGTSGTSMSIVGGNPGLSNTGLAFYDETNSATRMYITSGGNVGIGVTPSVWRSSERALQIGTATSLYDVFGITLLGNNFYTNTSSQSIYLTSGYASYYWQNSSDGSHSWNTAPSAAAGSVIAFTERMRITCNGNIGINTSTPSNLLHIEASNNTTNQFRVNSCDGANAGLRSYTTSDGAGLIINHYYAVGGSPYLRTSDFVSNQGDTASTQMRFFTKDASVNAALAMIITSGRCIGINTGSPSSLLDVQNCINSPYDNTNTLVSNQWIRTSNPSTCTGATSGILFVATGPGGGNGIATINGVTTSCGSMAITFGTRDASGAITERLRITSGGSAVFQGSLNTCNGGAINMTIPNGNNGGSIRMACCTGANEGDMFLTGGGGVGILIAGNGNIGMGNTNPLQALHLGQVSVISQDANSMYVGANFGKSTGGCYIKSQYANQIHFDSATGNINLKVANSGTAGNTISYTTAMSISNCGHILVNQAPNGQADYGRMTISTNTPKTSDPSTQEKTALHLSTCETDTPFGLKFQLIGDACSTSRYVAIQTGDHYISNQGSIVFQNSGGRVGIGTATPSRLLEVNGDTTLQGNNYINSTKMIQWEGGAYWSLRAVTSATEFQLYRGDTGCTPFVITPANCIKLNGSFVNTATVGLDTFTIDTMPGYQSIANGGYVDFGGMSGILFVNNWSNGGVTIWLMGGGGTVALGSVVATVGAMYHAPNVGGYRWCQNYGSTANFGFQVFRTRNTA
jgi:hypothetical protein